MTREDIKAQFSDATKEQIDAIMAIHGNDINAEKSKTKAEADKRKAAEDDLARLQGESDDINKVRKQLADTQGELDALKASNAANAARAKVAAEKGIPVELLTADTEEDCTAQADSLLAWKNPEGAQRYADTHDKGGGGADSAAGKDDAFRELANGLFS